MTPEIVKVEGSTIRKALMSDATIDPNRRDRELPMFLCKPAGRTDLFNGAAGYPHVSVRKAISCVTSLNHDIKRLIDARDHLIELIEQAVSEESSGEADAD